MDADHATDLIDPSSGSGALRPILSALPTLDPHRGRPLAPILRGAAADLGRLRSALSSNSEARRQLLESDLATTHPGTNAVGVEDDDDDRFSDASDEDPARALGGGADETGGHGAQQRDARGRETDDAGPVGDGGTKRGRENDDDDDVDVGGEESDEADDDREPVLLYLPSVRCTCPSWDMADVPGDVLVTALRVLFLPDARDADGVHADGARDDDLAIDGRCVALHAVDSLPPTDGEKDGERGASRRHVYCQLAESFGDEAVDGGGGVSATGTFAPARILEDIDGRFDDDDEDGDDGDDRRPEEDGGEDGGEEDGASSRGDGATVEVYFRPEGGTGGERDEGQSDKCQRLFDALTRLASLSAAGDDDGGFGFGGGGAGGLFGMLSLMAGLDGAANGFGDGMVVAGRFDEHDDDAVVRLGGGGNHLVEEEDDESEGASNEARRAMLDRLDNMLVVPPEYEVASSSSSEEDGRFEDAEEEEDDDGVDELL